MNVQKIRTREKKDVYTLTSVKNALRILSSFSSEEPEQRVTDIAKHLGISKSTVSRLMSTLADEGFVVQNQKTRKYRLGLPVLSLSNAVDLSSEIRREARATIRRLVERAGENVHLVTRDRTDVFYLDTYERKYPERFYAQVGGRNPMYCTSSGKVLLAYQKGELIRAVIQRGLKPYTPSTITNEERLLRVLEEVSSKGYAVSMEELVEGACSVAAPIRDFNGGVVAAVSIVGPKQRINSRTVGTYAKLAIEAAKEISARLGY
ncbi:MAG: IclR family transcriptional regulator [Alicyclobacillaceae bacterium]|nr:IclR family transcriptional regulator [Alicyclobacillaceae bacterium]